MEAIPFKPGPQTAGTEVIDSFGVHWEVLKNIANATAQPREGAYYMRVKEEAPAETIMIAQFHEDDFWIETETNNGVITNKIRIKR